VRNILGSIILRTIGFTLFNKLEKCGQSERGGEMQWKAKYEIGIELIDQQHRQLVETLTRLETATVAAQYREMGYALKFLVDYTNFHFSEEETFMQKIGYPAYDSHKALHKELIQKLMAILLKLKKGGTLEHQELIDFLMDWLANHILEADKKIGLFISKQKDSIETNEIHPPAIKEADIVPKLEKLKALFEKQLISATDYEDKKKSFLKQYSSVEVPPEIQAVDHKISFLGTLQKEHLITKEDEKEYKAILFSQINLESLLKQVPEIEKKLTYLKSFHDNGFITEETYENIKSKMLQEI
jgi:hemerythrin